MAESTPTLAVQDFKRLMAVLFSGLRKTHPSTKVVGDGIPSEMDVWFQFLSDISAQQLEIAVRRFVSEGRGEPTIAGLRELAGVAAKAETAWQCVRKAIGRYSGFDISFDPVTNATVRALGGWVKICRTNTKELGFLRPQFVKQWNTNLSNIADLKLTQIAGLRCEYDQCLQPVVVVTGVGLASTPVEPRIMIPSMAPKRLAGPSGISEVIKRRNGQ